MVGMTISDEEYGAAKDALDAAIHNFYRTVEPDTYINGWVLAAHKMSAVLEQHGATIVSTLVPTGQDFVLTRGIWEVGHDGQLATPADRV